MTRNQQPEYIYRTTAEWAAATAEWDSLASRHIGVDTDLGIMKQGPGLFSQLGSIGATVDQFVRVASTANVTISSGLNAGDTIDGVVLVAGDLVLLKDQSTAHQNGVYVVGGSPARSTSFDTYNEHRSKLIMVKEGTAGKGKCFRCKSAAGGTLDTTAIDFVEVPFGIFNLQRLSPLSDLPTKTPITADIICIQDSVSGMLMRCTLGQVGTLVNV